MPGVADAGSGGGDVVGGGDAAACGAGGGWDWALKRIDHGRVIHKLMIESQRSSIASVILAVLLSYSSASVILVVLLSYSSASVILVVAMP